MELHLTDSQKFIDSQDNGYGFGETYQTTHPKWWVVRESLSLDMVCVFTNLEIRIERNDRILLYSRFGWSHWLLRSLVHGARLIEVTATLLNIETDDPMVAFGYLDAFRVRSCMTLFKHIASAKVVSESAWQVLLWIWEWEDSENSKVAHGWRFNILLRLEKR